MFIQVSSDFLNVTKWFIIHNTHTSMVIKQFIYLLLNEIVLIVLFEDAAVFDYIRMYLILLVNIDWTLPM